MGEVFIHGGPDRYMHQRRGLQKLLKTGGIGALLFDPGLGKTATTLDYASILALKLPAREARILVIAPLAAIDTWVLQSEIWVSPQVNVWAEALGGSIRERAETLAARGGNPYKNAVTSGQKKLTNAEKTRKQQVAPRALNVDKSFAWFARADDRETIITPSEGPDGMGDAKPKLIVTAVNLDTFSRRDKHGSGTIADLMLDAVKRYKPDLVVVDEMHKIKSATSNVSRLLSRIGAVVPRRIGLTGTVMPAGPLDVFGQWRFLDPYAFGSLQVDGSRDRATFEGFKRRFAVLGGYMGREVTGYRNLDDMHKVMGQISVVARKKDALDLPPLTEVIVPVNLSPREAAAYAQMKKDLVVQMNFGVSPTGADATVGNRLAQLMRLRQITSGHLPDDLGTVHELGTSKVDTIRSIANDTLIGESRVVVFSMFTHEIEALTAKLKIEGTRIMTITGATPKDERLRMRQEFGSDDPQRMIIIAQVKTLSLAVNELVTASNAIFGSLSQQRDDLIQAIDRLNRIGQTRAMTIWYALAPNSVDTVIMKAHKERTDLESAMLKHIYEGES